MKTLIKNKNFWYIVAIAILAVASAVAFQEIAHAQFEALQGIGDKTKLPGGLPTHGRSSAEPGASQITSIIFVLIDVVKYFVGTLAVAWLIISGVRLVSAGEGIEKAADSQKKNIGYSIAALIIVILADQVVKIIFGETGDTFENTQNVTRAAMQGSALIEGIYGFVTKFIGAIAVLMIVVNGVAISASLGAEDAMKKYRNRILWSLGALILVLIAEFVVRGIIFPNPVKPELPSIEKTKQLIIQFTNFISGFISTAAVISLIYAGFLYVTGATNEENTKKAKTLITGAIIGLILALGAFAIVNTTVKLQKVADAPAPIGVSPQGF